MVEAIASRRIFQSVRQTSERELLLSRILVCEGRILSLRTLLEDTKYLEPCAFILKKLLPKSLSSSRFGSGSTFCSIASGQCIPIEVRKGEWIEVSALRCNATELAFTQLWLYAARNYPFMVPFYPRQDRGELKIYWRFRYELWQTMAQLALRLGFESPIISRLSNTELSKQDVLSILGHSIALPTSSDSEQRSCEDLHESGIGNAAPPVVGDERDEVRGTRCGRPYGISFLRNRHFLYIHSLSSLSDKEEGKYITAFGVTRDIFRSFFGMPSLESGLVAEVTSPLGNLSPVSSPDTGKYLPDPISNPFNSNA